MKIISKKILFGKKVFKPTGTSDLLYKSVLKYTKQSSKILDLGCGSGYVGISIAKNLSNKTQYYFSDISEDAVKLTKNNCKSNNINSIVKKGSLFKPWKEYKFDLIVNDVSGISENIAKISPWYNENIPIKAGKDGTKLTLNLLDQSPNFLNKGGKVFFPLISLSNYKKVLSFAKKKFNKVKKIDSKEWPLPIEMYKYQKIINKLKKDRIIFIKKKFGMIIFKTDIYLATL